MKCFHAGFERSTIARFRSAISAYRDRIDEVPVWKESQVTTLLAHIHNVGPPQP